LCVKVGQSVRSWAEIEFQKANGEKLRLRTRGCQSIGCLQAHWQRPYGAEKFAGKGYVCRGLSHGFLNSPISAFTIKLPGPIDNVPKASAPCANEVFHDLDHDLRESLLQRSIDSFTPSNSGVWVFEDFRFFGHRPPRLYWISLQVTAL
jgi:hypothetical protein